LPKNGGINNPGKWELPKSGLKGPGKEGSVKKFGKTRVGSKRGNGFPGKPLGRKGEMVGKISSVFWGLP